MRRFWLVVLGLLVLLACIPAKPSETAHGPFVEHSVCIDNAFSVEETIAISSAIYDWNNNLHGVVNLKPLPLDAHGSTQHCRIAILRVTSSTPWVAAEHASNTLGLTDNIGGRYIWLIADRQPDLLRTTAAHEIGHALGLKHTMTGLMKASIDWDEKVSGSDAVWAAYSLGLEQGKDQ